MSGYIDMEKRELPIDAVIPEIIETLESHSSLIVEAEPGAGKTTRVPPAVYFSELGKKGEIWVLEPRRLAAWMAARRVAEEMGERVGSTVGYHVRFEAKCSAATRIRFITEGLFNRWLLDDPLLSNVSAVIVDEVHERSVQADMALALLRGIQEKKRPDLKIIAMSATADSARLSAFLGGAPVLKSAGRVYPVEVKYLEQNKKRPVGEQVEDAVRFALDKKEDGHLLVFLPGASEIREAARYCEGIAEKAGMLITPLHADLPAEERDRAVLPTTGRKLILSTNVAETSVTIEGTGVVIDSGLKRAARVSPWSGLQFLSLERISKASAAQRMGRAGRTGPGLCLRLYSQGDFAGRPEFDTPEILSADLSESLLFLFALVPSCLTEFRWYEMPPEEHLRGALQLLSLLGAIEAGELTEAGRKMLALPLHPRLSRLVLEMHKYGLTAAGCLAAAVLGEKELRRESKVSFKKPSAVALNRTVSKSDLADSMECFLDAAANRNYAVRDVDQAAFSRARRVFERLCGAMKVEARVPDLAPCEEMLGKAVLSAYSDRAGRFKSRDVVEFSGGRLAALGQESAVRDSEFLVALDAEEQQNQRGLGTRTVIRKASAIEAEWLLEFYPGRFRDDVRISWNSDKERVECSEVLLFDELVLSESQTAGQASTAAVESLLTEKALKAGIMQLGIGEDWSRLCARTDFLSRHFPSLAVTKLDDTALSCVIKEAARGNFALSAIKESLSGGGLLDLVARTLGMNLREHLSRFAPDFIRLPGRARVPVNYQSGKSPWIESRIQDFFGLKASPLLGEGNIPLVVHLLAPNNRAVQVTDDLKGFWEKHYDALRKQLSRRYPKHRWPERPA